tara:strand:- start:534 stop:683 length:150 start_codon:yes stop_codon:yes gene_type:complete
MSKNSAKAMYTQLMEWMPTLNRPKGKTTNTNNKPGKRSRLNTYKNKGVR